MGKRSNKQQAARQREAVKRVGPNTVTPPVDPSLAQDPSYVADPGTDGEDATEGTVASGSLKRKRASNSDRDLILENSALSIISRTTAWRNSTGQTKQARAKNMQSSINSLFKSVPNKRKAAVAEPYGRRVEIHSHVGFGSKTDYLFFLRTILFVL
ncbi:hypothetical protein DFH09DRAFT_1204392 [Mycena vulgaris]|nr:hypothetical protein DFH09DRAFT_1204392 [Mycena vulgaris]